MLARRGHLPLNLGVIPLDRGARSLERGLGADQPLLSSLQDVTAAIDRLLLAPEDVGDGLAQGSPAFVERLLEVRQSPFLLIEFQVAGVAGSLALIGDGVPLVGNAIPLVGDALALVGDSLPLVVKRV